MNQEGLAEKYRPKKFSEIIGQSRAINEIRDFLGGWIKDILFFHLPGSKFGEHLGCHAALFRKRQRSGLQGRPALPRGHERRFAPALLDAVPPLPSGRPRANGRGVHPHHACDECYVSIRSYLDKSLPQLFREYIPEFFSFKTEYKPAETR
jgi:hypothetical protein